MIEWIRLTSESIRHIDKQLPVIVPVGLVESHGPHLTLGVDCDTAGYFARRIAESSGAILAPAIHYGFADEMKEYPGTVGVAPETLALVVRDISMMFCSHGFKKVIFLSGHGANKLGVELGFYKVWEVDPDFKPACWNWWSDAGIGGVHHADKGETEVAAAVGSPIFPERIQDFKFAKPWHKVRSRFTHQPESGGINGKPSEYDPAEGERIREQAVRVLTEKVMEAIRDKG